MPSPLSTLHSRLLARPLPLAFFCSCAARLGGQTLGRVGSRRPRSYSLTSRLSTLALILILSACSGATIGEGYTNPSTDRKARDQQQESILGSDGLQFGQDNKKNQNGLTGIGVNGYLWRAALDTVAFMPLLSADPFGGVIITDWYAPAAADGSPQERFKLNVYILTRELRADGIKITAFRQNMNAAGAWVDAPPTAKIGEQIENAILARARELRIASEGR